MRRGAASEAAAIESDIPAGFLQAEGVRVDEVIEVVPPAEAMAEERRAAPPDLELSVDLAPGEGGLLVLRHPSGAITFHPSSEARVRSGRRGAAAAAASTTAVFRIPVRRAAAEGRRRGIVSNALKVIVVKVAKAVLDRAARVALPILASRWEAATWKRKGLGEGWFRVAANGTAGLTLTPGMPPAGERSLLLVHGTFSNANGAFGPLARTDFFQRVAPLYGDRIFAFNHFTISRTPEENARMLLEPLGAGERELDAITHSRGGLVLRNVVEHGGRFGSLAARFRLGHAVLVASPNDGTPLATPARWQETVGWFANLMELFPEHPLTTGVEWVAESIVWLASHLTGDLPGLRAMDGAGDLVAGLQSPPGPPAGAYSALVANYHPDATLWQRAVDVGVDQFFGSANDLVVPSEGGWRIDRDGTAHVPGARIGCFGPGGNLRATPPVHHLGFFDRAETARFLAAALAGESHELPPIDPRAPLPDRRFTRGAAAAIATAERGEERAIEAFAAAGPSLASIAVPQGAPYDASDAFHIVVLDAFESPEAAAQRERPRWARVLATYAGARVMASMRLNAGKGEPPTAFGRIIAFHERIRSYTNREKGTLPADEEMMRFGGLLFETLFQGDVRRLYDEARSRQRGRKLDLVLTSVIPWIAEKPWEFCYDTARASFLATEEIHFVRNVLTAVPADVTETRSGPLRLLVAAAQPIGHGRLSIEQEDAVIRRGFQPLEAAGLLSIDLLPRATPEALHRRLESRQFDAVHFIGHGDFDEEKQEGCLIFENDRGGAYTLGQRSVREIFCGRGLSLVFLNSCQSGTGGRAGFNGGVAQSLVAHGLPALVANQYSVLDSSATSFAQYFYASLAQGHTLGHAAREARIAVNYSMQGELIDWAIPVLYARDPNRVLCAPAAAAAAQDELLTVTSRARRGGTATRARRIAVWDVDMIFPSIEAMLDRMNAAQQVFGFELADISVPLDAWDRSSDTEYLQAERVARRLRARPVQLGVDLLACITSHWLSDDTDTDLYAWWPDDRDPAIGLLSSAGLKLDPEGPQTERAIVNALVSVLAGFFAAIGTHESGVKSCPLFYNRKRDMGHITGTQKFDAGCRRALRQSIPDELPALEALLAAFA